ncbi:MAG: inosine/xanthosine triphosphatase [Candidatus Levybacteria bacterium CG10_big_fil_rev_8_21_14_0_10_36_7]|nr:MAG: inosine/xanthosine triphosphatase [Candidatus Levybacteria bacterium CG10_big_fil_rev_8_21_14_0_10_36_7]
MENKIIVAVGSKNKTKTKPVKEVFSKHFKNLKVVAVEVDSGVNDQPMSDDETFLGAKNRAQAALKKVKDADFGVGIEGGIHEYSYGHFERSMVVIMDRKGNFGVGATGGLLLPPVIIKQLKEGKNLEEAVDFLFGTKKIGEGIGMFGLMTKGVVTRSSGTTHGVAFALSRFLHEKLY